MTEISCQHRVAVESTGVVASHLHCLSLSHFHYLLNAYSYLIFVLFSSCLSLCKRRTLPKYAANWWPSIPKKFISRWSPWLPPSERPGSRLYSKNENNTFRLSFSLHFSLGSISFFSFNLKRFYPEMYDVMFHSVDVEPSSFLNWYFFSALLWSTVINEINIRYENSRHADDFIIILLAPSAFLVILPGHPGFHWMKKPGGFFFFSNFSGYLL